MENEQKESLQMSSNRFLTFYLEDEIYGVNIFDVKEIIAMMNTTAVPKTPSYIKGVMNLRGNIIPVVDMRLKFDMDEKEPEMYTAIVIINIEGKNIGFIVDKVEEVVTVDKENISAPPEFGFTIDTKFINQMARIDEKVIMILDLIALFGQEELAMVQSLNKAEV